jgi:hypothetical protein
MRGISYVHFYSPKRFWESDRTDGVVFCANFYQKGIRRGTRQTMKIQIIPVVCVDEEIFVVLVRQVNAAKE